VPQFTVRKALDLAGRQLHTQQTGDGLGKPAMSRSRRDVQGHRGFLHPPSGLAAVLLALVLMRTGTLQQVSPVMRQARQLREGLRYIHSQPELWVPLMMMALVGTLAYEFPVVLPLLAQTGMSGDARTYGFLTSAMGCGAILGGLGIAIGGRVGVVPLLAAACGFGAAMLAAAVVGPLPAELTALGFVGVGSTAFLATGNTTLQWSPSPTSGDACWRCGR
jgi:hypothetical protein